MNLRLLIFLTLFLTLNQIFNVTLKLTLLNILEFKNLRDKFLSLKIQD